MLILAGVSINAIVGVNGIISQVTNAKLVSEEVARREALEMILFDYNSSEFLGDAEGMHKFLSKVKEEGQIGNYAVSTDEDYAIIKYDNKNYEIVRESEGSTYYKISDEVDGNILEEGDNFILTQKTLDTEDGFTFENGNSYIVIDEKLTADEFDFNIPAGDPVTIKIMHDMDIDNKDVANRSAINLEKGATLNLYIYGKVNVNSSFGIKSQPATGDGFTAETGIPGGSGAYAGIHVPEGAILNLYGTGILTAVGGDAGDGGDGGYNNLDWGGAGGGGAGAGIGGHGGKGGTSISFSIGNTGYKGENAGNINIYNSLTVKAFGGGGGTGGAVSKTENSVQSGGGGSGYPAAGIGGGGAGGTSGNTQDSGGGFGAGNGEYTFHIGGENGCTLANLQNANTAISGSYYESYAIFVGANTSQQILWNGEIPCNPKWQSGGIGGGGTGGYGERYIPDSASAGKGGQIRVSSNAKIYAYNGSYITTKNTVDMTEEEKISTQALIYAQAGYDIKAIRELLKVKKVTARTIADLVSEWSTSTNNYSAQRTIISPYKNGSNQGKFVLGIGSGAGCSQEIDGNGTYTIDSSMN